MNPAILTCALTGVLTNPQQHPVPVTPAQMAAEARDAFNAGASVMHVHLRSQEPGMGHLPSWDPDVATAVVGLVAFVVFKLFIANRMVAATPAH